MCVCFFYGSKLSLVDFLFDAVILALGVKSSSIFTNVFTILNLAVVIFVITAGMAYGIIPSYIKFNFFDSELFFF